MTHRLQPVIIVLLCLLTCNSYAQKDTAFLSHATIALEKYVSANPTEKVYLQLDKSNYDLQDTVWYKAYTVIGQHHQLSALSGVLYVELIGPADTVMSRQILRLTSGVAWGGMEIPDKAKPGDYHIRAYTNWMRNAGPEYFYNQKIHIGGYETTSVPKVAQGKPDVQFFPEGGWLVNGLRSKVAIKAVGANGYGQDVKGTIEDNEGIVVADFATRHLGMGDFAFTPQSGKSYKARINAGETTYTIQLPLVKDEGYTLGINNSEPDSIFIKVAANELLFKQKQHSKFYITAQSAGKVYYAATGNLEDKTFTSSVDKKRFPSGIVQFTLFSENGEPLNERSAFIQNDDTLRLNINTITATTVRQRIKIDLNAKKNSIPSAGTFSVAVINENMVGVNETTESNIVNKLLLTSDLKGYVEQPNYYFINPSEQTAADLDVLMLTQGYQRYEWKRILKDSLPTITYQPEETLELNGNIKTAFGKPVPNGKITLIDTRDKLLMDTTTDNNGNFKFAYLELPDSARVILSAKKINNSNNVTIAIKPMDYPPVIKSSIRKSVNNGIEIITIDSAKTSNIYQKQKLDFLNKKRQLKEVVIKARFEREKPDLNNSDNLNGPGMADQIIISDQFKDCIKLSDCLGGLMRSVTFINGIPRNYGYHHPHTQPPIMTLIVDGAVDPGIKIDDLNPTSIHSIEVLQSDSFLGVYGGKAGGGALVITTKRGGDKDFFDGPNALGTLKYTFKGFYKVQEFYSPKYDSPKNNTTIPDLRSTIYWNPNVTTDKDGKASFEYFNADTKGTYRVVVEGIDGDGNLGRQVYRYKVE